jgi:ubiquinone/menaquinone biosynthesis C-methylase UbiE
VTFQDHFSRVSADYSRYRPRYPAALFDWLASLTPRHTLAWDCATGSGQAASGLAAHFDRVVATDGSADQIVNATPLPNVEYRVAPAERSGLEAGSVDLVTCAQALHWLPLEAFYAEVQRVLTGAGAIAVWGYHVPIVDDGEVDRHIRHFHNVVVGPYWPAARQLVEDRFSTIAFPFDEIAAPSFDMRVRWTLEDYARYLGTQSATDRYREAHAGHDPVPAFVAAVEELWGGRDHSRDVHFPMFVRVGRPARQL